MITLDALEMVIDRLQLPQLGREYLKRVASSPPSRRVRSVGTNVVCRFPSRKMGVVIQAESHRNELALVHVLEHDPNVIGYWDQPEPFKISYISATGHLVSPTITPDYLVLRNDGVQWIEAKPPDALPELAKEKPNRYARGEDGKWRCAPAEKASEAYGFTYHIWTPSDVNPTWLRNIQLLTDYFGTDIDTVPTGIRIQIKKIVQERPGISIAEIRQIFDNVSADHIHKLIVHDHVYVDLAATSLTVPQGVKAFSNRETAEAYVLMLNGNGYNGSLDCSKASGLTPTNRNSVNYGIQLDGKTAAVPSTSHVLDPALSGAAAELFSIASQEDLAIAIRRCRILTDEEFARANPVPNRTLRRWKRLFRLGEERYGYGFLGLIPRFKDRGNRASHFSDQLLSFVDGIIDSVYCTASRPNKRHTYDRLRIECQDKGHLTPSYPWFRKRINSHNKYKLTMSREGKRVAHKYEVIGSGGPNDNHGAFPWDVCLADHTLIDAEAICSETGGNLGRPWLSILSCGFSRRILAFCLTFDPPSYRTLMILMRRCVERHNQLPRCLVVDNGKEFHSTYFETLTANYGITVKRRPAGKPRYGSIIERLFGTLNTTFFHTLAGNTQNLRNIRQMTKSMNPKLHAIYSLEDLHDMLSHFAFEFYENRPHSTLNCTPAEKYERGIEISGARAHRSIAYDETFRLMTLPTTSRGTAKVQPGMGVKINGFYYWSIEMCSRHFEGQSVRVKYDPENLGVVWTYLGDQWVQCRSNGTLNLEGKSEKEMRIATTEWRRSRQLLGYSQSHSQKAFVQYLKSTEAAKVLRVQQAKDRAMKRASSPRTNSELPPVSELSKSHDSAPLDPSPPEPSKPEPITPLAQEDYGDL